MSVPRSEVGYDVLLMPLRQMINVPDDKVYIYTAMCMKVLPFSMVRSECHTAVMRKNSRAAGATADGQRRGS